MIQIANDGWTQAQVLDDCWLSSKLTLKFLHSSGKQRQEHAFKIAFENDQAERRNKVSAWHPKIRRSPHRLSVYLGHFLNNNEGQKKRT
jgi:hypothetical protein